MADSAEQIQTDNHALMKPVEDRKKEETQIHDGNFKTKKLDSLKPDASAKIENNVRNLIKIQ